MEQHNLLLHQVPLTSLAARSTERRHSERGTRDGGIQRGGTWALHETRDLQKFRCMLQTPCLCVVSVVIYIHFVIKYYLIIIFLREALWPVNWIHVMVLVLKLRESLVYMLHLICWQLQAKLLVWTFIDFLVLHCWLQFLLICVGWNENSYFLSFLDRSVKWIEGNDTRLCKKIAVGICWAFPASCKLLFVSVAFSSLIITLNVADFASTQEIRLKQQS